MTSTGSRVDVLHFRSCASDVWGGSCTCLPYRFPTMPQCDCAVARGTSQRRAAVRAVRIAYRDCGPCARGDERRLLLVPAAAHWPDAMPDAMPDALLAGVCRLFFRCAESREMPPYTLSVVEEDGRTHI